MLKSSSSLTLGWAVIMVVGGAMFVLLVLWVCFMISLPILMGIGMASDEVVQHEVASPDGEITALVIRDDCGATCSCAMRVDLKTSTEYVEEVYRSFSACDAQVVWQGSTEFRVEDDAGGEELIDVRDWGISP